VAAVVMIIATETVGAEVVAARRALAVVVTGPSGVGRR
jgi:hypothetical protein